MAQIDTSSIQGFAEMSDADKVAALLKVDVPERVDLSGYVKKDLFDKTSSELAEAKKQVKARMNEDEAAAAAKAEEFAALQAKVEEITAANEKLQREKLEAGYKAKYLAMPGFDENLADSSAKAMADGDMDKVFANQQKANENYQKQLKAEMVKGDPKPGGAGGGDDEPDNVKWARERAKQRAAEMKTGGGNMSKYKI